LVRWDHIMCGLETAADDMAPSGCCLLLLFELAL